MSNCIYRFTRDSEKSYTYQELVQEFQNKPGITEASDIVFSRGAAETTQDSIYSRLAQLRAEGFVKGNVSYQDGEPVISDNDSISTQEFIDTPAFVYNNRALITKMSDEDYINSVVSTLVAEGMTENQARAIAKQEVEHWQTIGADSAELHTLISKYDVSRDKSIFRGTKFEDIAGQLCDTLNFFKRTTFGAIKARSRGIESRIISNLNLKAELEGLDKTLFGHIDMVVIDGNSDLHLFNYKVTTTSIQPKSVKLEKYKYQMALLKQILASHGFKVRNATLNIVPIKVNYNDDYTKVTGAVVNRNPIELTVSNGRYVFDKYDTVAKHFIKSTMRVDQVTSEDLQETSEQLDLIFPEREIKATGIRLTAQEWIRKNRSTILDSNNPEYAYEVEFGEGDVAKIRSHTKPEYNEDLLEEIAKRQHLLDTNQSIVLDRLLKAVRGGVENGKVSFLQERAYSKCGAYLNIVFQKYFPHSSEEKSDWEFVENDLLNGAGIILLKNKNTDQLDVVALSPCDLGVKVNFKRGDSLLGSYLYNTKSGSLVNYKSTYGNIEAVRAMVLLNQVLPKLGGDFVLGKLQVLSLVGAGQGIPFSMESFNKECFSLIIKYINTFPNTSVTNNFINYRFIDRFGTLLQEYDSIIKDTKASESEKQELIEAGFESLNVANSIEARLNALRQVEQALKEGFPGLTYGSIQNASKNVDENIARLYQMVVDAITYYNVGEISTVEQKISSINRNAMVSSRVPNRNFQLVVNLYTETINKIAEQAESKWVPIRKLLFKFYDDIGYSRIQNSTIGNLAQQFDDLYRRDINGKKLLRLLNPYDAYDMAQIKTHRGVKQQFLKRILFEFAKIKYPMNGIKFNFTSESDPNLQAFIEQHRDTYFNIPLEKASSSTRMQNYSVREKLEYMAKRVKTFIKDPKMAINELNDIFNSQERGLLEQSIESKQLHNKFLIGEGSGRSNYIAEHGENYFETNLETLLADFIERDIETREYNKALITTKGILAQLDLLGEHPNQKAIVEQTKKMIEDFVTVNVFRASIMEETSQKIMGAMQPFRDIVSNTLIAGNIISMLRDTFEGTWHNTVRTITKYQTDIDATSLAKAYATVVQNSFTDGRSINIVNQLCQIYRLSNIDVSRISEGLKSERGMTNFHNWMYATLRRPDFLNRMTLFVAKCYKDGVYGAFDIKDGKLVYNWKKDKRFEIYASGNTSHPKYAEQMGAYYNAIRAYNQDHPEATIGFDEALPMPYSFQEVEVMKNVANSIYGSYDRSTRAAYEHMAIGTFFGMFSTWMNGIYSNYMMKPGSYQNGQLQLKQAEDSSGNLLFFDNFGQTVVQIKDKDGVAKYFYEGTQQEALAENLTKMQPIMDKVPIVIQGIFYTLRDFGKALKNGDVAVKDKQSWTGYKWGEWLDPVNRANFAKLFSDILAWILFGCLFKFALTPAYKEFKKGMKEREVLTNAAVELLYKSSSRSYDGFRGIWNVWEYLGENTNPPIWSQNIKIMTDLGKMTFGDKPFNDVLNGSVAVFKTAQDTWRAYDKAHAE